MCLESFVPMSSMRVCVLADIDDMVLVEEQGKAGGRDMDTREETEDGLVFVFRACGREARAVEDEDDAEKGSDDTACSGVASAAGGWWCLCDRVGDRALCSAVLSWLPVWCRVCFSAASSACVFCPSGCSGSSATVWAARGL